MHISSKCSIAVHCLIFVYEYGQRTKVTSELLSQSSGCNPVTIRNIMSALKKAGIVSVKSGTGGISLCCSPEEITLYRICECVEPDALDKLMGVHPKPSTLCPIGRNIQSVLQTSYEKIRSDLKASLLSISMGEILDDYHRTSTGAEISELP